MFFIFSFNRGDLKLLYTKFLFNNLRNRIMIEIFYGKQWIMNIFQVAQRDESQKFI